MRFGFLMACRVAAITCMAVAIASGEPLATDVTASSHVAAPVDYTSMLFVFVLSTFIGLGVILRVSRLLHTPLMSLTNAISAIAVVGSIIVTGCRLSAEDSPAGRHRAVRFDDQHRQRIPDHRPHAEDVQADAAGGEG